MNFHALYGDSSGNLYRTTVSLIFDDRQNTSGMLFLSPPKEAWLPPRRIYEQKPLDFNERRSRRRPAISAGTLKHLEERYGGIEGYVRSAGLTPEQIETLRHAVVE